MCVCVAKQIAVSSVCSTQQAWWETHRPKELQLMWHWTGIAPETDREADRQTVIVVWLPSHLWWLSLFQHAVSKLLLMWGQRTYCKSFSTCYCPLFVLPCLCSYTGNSCVRIFFYLHNEADFFFVGSLHMTLHVCMCFCVCVCVFLTTIADIICGAKSHRALEQDWGNWQPDSSLMMITAASTSWRTVKEKLGWEDS